jgi:hypothetical protein
MKFQWMVDPHLRVEWTQLLLSFRLIWSRFSECSFTLGQIPLAPRMTEVNLNPLPGQFFFAAWMNFSLPYFFLLVSVGLQPADLYIRHDDVLVTLVHNEIQNEELSLAMVGNFLHNLLVSRSDNFRPASARSMTRFPSSPRDLP